MFWFFNEKLVQVFSLSYWIHETLTKTRTFLSNRFFIENISKILKSADSLEYLVVKNPNGCFLGPVVQGPMANLNMFGNDFNVKAEDRPLNLEFCLYKKFILWNVWIIRHVHGIGIQIIKTYTR